MYQCEGLVYVGGGDVVPLVADVDEAMFCGGVDELFGDVGLGAGEIDDGDVCRWGRHWWVYIGHRACDARWGNNGGFTMSGEEGSGWAVGGGGLWTCHLCEPDPSMCG